MHCLNPAPHMSQFQGAWGGEPDVFADAEEQRVLFATLDSFR